MTASIQKPETPFKAIRVLVPGTGSRFRCGGLSVALQTSRLLGNLRPTCVVTYRQKTSENPYLFDLLKSELPSKEILWLVSWGFDVPFLLGVLKGRRVVYQAHSSGYGFDLPPGVPIVAVSRNTLGYWGSRAPRNPLFLVSNALDSKWFKQGNRISRIPDELNRRQVDVLVQRRKSSPYVLDILVPALRKRGLVVEVQDGWVDDLVALFNGASVYIYDSADYWRSAGVTEGFGLPPLEALACGCVVFSSLNHALADTLTPSKTIHQLGCGSLSYDVERIFAAAKCPWQWHGSKPDIDQLLEIGAESNCLEQWSVALSEIEKGFPYWDHTADLLLNSSQLVLRVRRLIRSFRSRLAASVNKLP